MSTIGSASTVPGTAAGDSVVRGGSATHGSTHDSVDGGSVASHDSGHNLRASIERHESEDRHHDARSVGGDSVAFSDLALSELSRYRKELFFSRKFKIFVHKKHFLASHHTAESTDDDIIGDVDGDVEGELAYLQEIPSEYVTNAILPFVKPTNCG